MLTTHVQLNGKRLSFGNGNRPVSTGKGISLMLLDAWGRAEFRSLMVQVHHTADWTYLIPVPVQARRAINYHYMWAHASMKVRAWIHGCQAANDASSQAAAGSNESSEAAVVSSNSSEEAATSNNNNDAVAMPGQLVPMAHSIRYHEYVWSDGTGKDHAEIWRRKWEAVGYCLPEYDKRRKAGGAAGGEGGGGGGNPQAPAQQVPAEVGGEG